MTYAVRSKEGHVVRRFASHAEAEAFVRTAQSPSRKTDRHTEKARLLQAWHEASAAVNRAKQAFDEAWRTDMRKVEPARKVLLKAVAVEERAHRKAARLEYSPSRRGPSEQEQEPLWEESPTQRVPTAKINAAVEAARFYHGSEGLPVKTQQRFYAAMMRKIAAVVKATGASDQQFVFDQIVARARSVGRLMPRPGKDY